MTTLLSLPPEVVGLIADRTARKDLKNLRLVCRDISKIANRTFALVEIAERCCELSRFSIATLVEVSGHPFFGRYLKTVNIVMKRRRLGMGKAFVQSEQYTLLMEQVFSNIRKHQGSANVGIYDWFDKDDFNWNITTHNGRNTSSECYHEALEHTLATASRAQCPVHRLHLRLNFHQTMTPTGLLAGFFRYNKAPFKLDITFQSDDDPDDDNKQLAYDQDQRSLRVSGEYWFTDSLLNGGQTSSLQLIATLLMNRGVSRLNLVDYCTTVEGQTSQYIYQLINRPLDNVCFENVSLYLGHGPDDNPWSQAIELLSKRTDLKVVRLRRLQFSPGRTGIKYPVLLPGGVEEFEAKGEELATKLRDLAVCVAKEEEEIKKRITLYGYP